MYRSLLVPLDGSIMAEQALFPAAEIAARLGASLTLALVHPSGPLEDAPFPGTAPDHALRAGEAGYLEGLRLRALATFHVAAEIKVLEGDVVPALLAFAGERGIDLVVSSTHGRGLVGRLVQGDVALKLSHGLTCPTLLIKPLRQPPAPVPPTGFRHILLPLDGSRRSETVIEPALGLAAPGGRVTLAQVVTPAPGRPLIDRRRDALRYLFRVADGLEARGVEAECRVLTRAGPAPALLELAAAAGADLIALTTRERSEGERILLGSVADALVHRGNLPVLVCHGTLRESAEEPIADAAEAWRFAPLAPEPWPA